jgi:quinol monooxygenase YgiN
MSELAIFGRFRARPSEAQALAEAIAAVLPPTRAEPGCLAIEAFRSTRDPDLFFIHSRWLDEAAFDLHAGLAHTLAFLDCAGSLIDHPLDIQRTRALQRD